MFAFILKIIVAVACVVVAQMLISYSGRIKSEEEKKLFRWGSLFARIFATLMVIWAFVGTSMILVPAGKIATMKRIYFGRALEPGQIVARDGQLGPQAKILTAGFHAKFMITVMNDIEYVDVFTVPNGKCAIMSAKDGLPIPGGSAFADPWKEEDKLKMANDAEYFLMSGKGQRGPQTTVLMPSSYTINPFLWEQPELIEATRVEQGTVGVVKSSILAAVDFGPFKRQIPTNDALQVLTRERMPRDSAAALIVPVGAIGVWEEPLPNGLYYINTAAYKVTMVPTVAQVYEYKGGYKRRTVDISVNDKGQIVERVTEEEVQVTPDVADKAIFTQPEGWNVAQELRVIAQVEPELAPFVVASLGLTEENASRIIEDRVVTPIIRSTTRDVEGGAQIPVRQMKAILDQNGNPIINENGEPQTQLSQEFRPVKVLDLLENRSSIEEAIEERSRPEALKEGVTINEIRLSESSIPAELLIARKREQLAQQLTKAWKQEEIAQVQRQKVENARAQAEQQSELVKAEIAAKAALERKNARTTEGEGEQAYLVAIAEGQKAQAAVLGEEMTAKLQIFNQALKSLEGIIEKNPELLTTGIQNAQKFVPSVVVSSSAGGNGLEGAAAVLGHMLGNRADIATPKSPALANK